MQQRAQHLVENREHSGVRQRSSLNDVLAVSFQAAQQIGKRPERVVADHQVGPVFDGHVDVGRAPHAPVDVIDAIEAGRLEQAW